MIISKSSTVLSTFSAAVFAEKRFTGVIAGIVGAAGLGDKLVAEVIVGFGGSSLVVMTSNQS